MVSNSSRKLPVLQIRLVEEDSSYCTYGEAYEVNCARYGRQPDQPIVQFKKRICDERGQLIIDPKGELRQQVRLTSRAAISNFKHLRYVSLHKLASGCVLSAKGTVQPQFCTRCPGLHVRQGAW